MRLIHQSGDTVYLWFAVNDASGSGSDGAGLDCDVRQAGVAAGAGPVVSPTATLLTHAGFPAGCFEVAIDTVGWANGSYAVFATATVDSANPTGLIGSFELTETYPIAQAPAATDTLLLSAQELITLCALAAEDVAQVTYTQAHWIAYLNQAVRALLLVRPHAAVAMASVRLTAGTRQLLPVGYERLLAIPRNMGSAGVSPGKAVTGPKPMEQMDLLAPDWHTQLGQSQIDEYYYDPARAKVFYVNPPVAASPAVYIEMHAVHPPEAVTEPADPVGLDSIYAAPLMEFMLYLAFARDHEATPNFARSNAHLQRFMTLLGVRDGAEMAIAPQALEAR